MKKILFSLVAGLVLCAGVAAQEIHFGVLNGPSCIPAGYLLDDTSAVKGAVVSYEKYADPQALLPKMLKGEVDIGFLPANVAAKVYNSTNGAIKVCAITGNGNISLITTDPNVKQLADLKGKTVAVAGQGATPEYMLRYLLEKSGIQADTPKGISLDFSIPTAQIAAQLISGKIDYAVVPEPFATVAQTKSDKVFVAVDFQKEYEYLEGKGKVYPLTVMVVTTKFAEANPKALKAFLNAYEKSYKNTLKNPKKAGELSEKFELGLAAPIVTKSIPKANYVYIPTAGGKAQEKIEELLNIFLAFEPSSIGGKLPDEGFYFK
ncbi:MAG: ABC transporter substrate-binding protein [Treponema sp.]|nr:ABC transporter substrate-binding protein [Treponema sp.]